MAGTAGKTFFVHPSGDDTFNGRTWANAVATLAGADALVTSGNGDKVVIAPSATAYVAGNFTKDYTTYLAMVRESGFGRPDISGASGVSVTGQGVVMKGLRFVATAGRALTLTGDGYHVEDCVAEGTTDAIALVASATDGTKTASEGRILRCLLRDSATGLRFKNSGGAIGTGPTHVVVMGCRFLNITSEDVIDEDTAGSNDNTYSDCIVIDNDHLDRNKAVYVTLTNGGNNRGVFGGRFAVDSGLVTATMVALATGIVAVGVYGSKGLTDSSAF